MQRRILTHVWTNLDKSMNGEIAGLQVTIPEAFLDKAESLAAALMHFDMHIAMQNSLNTGFKVAVMVYELDGNNNEIMVEDKEDGNPATGKVYVNSHGSIGISLYSSRHDTRIECSLGRIEELREMFEAMA